MSEDNSDRSSDYGDGPRPQQEVTMLFCVEDFEREVLKDVENLCSVVVTSTLCTHSGIRRLKYPKYIPPVTEVKKKGSDSDEEAEEEAEEEEEEATGKRSSFFEEMKEKLISSSQNLTERRHVRFFHICACAVEETNIKPLLARDAALNITGRKPNEVEIAELHQTAYNELVTLLHLLEVRCTPCMLFFVCGLPLRYSLIPSDTSSPENRVRPMGDRDKLWAHGANVVKWKKVLFNAVVVRNEMLKMYDAEVRAKLQEERRTKRKQEWLERRRKAAEEEEEMEGDEEEDDV